MQKVILPFVSGFLAALFFREATIALLHAAGVIDFAGYSTAPFLPLGIPEFIANALWSSVFGDSDGVAAARRARAHVRRGSVRSCSAASC